MADLGDTLNFRADLYDKPAEQGGILTNASTVTLTITLPDGTTTSPAVTNPPTDTGKYLYDYVTTTASLPGRYVGQWQFTMSGGKTTSYVETFDVGASLVTTDEAAAHLRAAGIITTANDLEQLHWLCLVATDAVERDLGRPIVRRTVVETHDGNTLSIVLRQHPVISVTSVVESGTALSATPGVDWVLIAHAGVLYRGTATAGLWWAWGRQTIVVTYVAGYADPPRSVRQVALGTVQELWQASQQASHSILTEGADLAVQSAASALPGPLRGAYNRLRTSGVA